MRNGAAPIRQCFENSFVSQNSLQRLLIIIHRSQPSDAQSCKEADTSVAKNMRLCMKFMVEVTPLLEKFLQSDARMIFICLPAFFFFPFQRIFNMVASQGHSKYMIIATK